MRRAQTGEPRLSTLGMECYPHLSVYRELLQALVTNATRHGFHSGGHVAPEARATMSRAFHPEESSMLTFSRKKSDTGTQGHLKRRSRLNSRIEALEPRTLLSGFAD